nr:protein 5NUC-like [Onthophagus taurus]
MKTSKITPSFLLIYFILLLLISSNVLPFNNTTLPEENDLNSTTNEDEEINSTISEGNPLILRILHTSNIKGHFEEQTDKSNVNQNITYGGVARIAYIVNKIRNLKSEDDANTLYVDVGDVSVGTVWTAVHRDTITTTFMNALKPDVMCLGNHEFDYGISGLLKFARNVTFPLVVSNLVYNNETELESLIKPSVILTINGTKIGIVGFLAKFTSHMTNLKTLKVTDELSAVTKECKKLTEQGIKIIIALGHTGFRMCKRIGKFVEDIDAVICGHRHTFLYNGIGPSSEEPLDGYPRRVSQKHGKLVPVVHTYGYTKYIGDFNLTFDANGTVTYSDGEPIFLNEMVPQDEKILSLLDKFRPEVVELSSSNIGQCLVDLDIECRKFECNYGNLAVDAFIRYRMVRYKGKDWTDTAVALFNSGAIRVPVITNIYNTNVTKGDIYASFPYRHPLYIVKMTGKDFLKVLQQSAQSYDKGGFLITAGLKIIFNDIPALTPTINSVLIRSIDEHNTPTYVPIKMDALYNFITTEYLVKGGDRYSIIQNNAKLITPLEVTDVEAIIEYFKVIKDLMPAVEGKYVFKQLTDSAVQITLPIDNLHVVSIVI